MYVENVNALQRILKISNRYSVKSGYCVVNRNAEGGEAAFSILVWVNNLLKFVNVMCKEESVARVWIFDEEADNAHIHSAGDVVDAC